MKTLILLSILTLSPTTFAQSTSPSEQSVQIAKKMFMSLGNRAKAASMGDWNGACHRVGPTSEIDSSDEMKILSSSFELLANHEVFTRLKNDLGPFFMMRLSSISEANLQRTLQYACQEKNFQDLKNCGDQITNILSQE